MENKVNQEGNIYTVGKYNDYAIYYKYTEEDLEEQKINQKLYEQNKDRIIKFQKLINKTRDWLAKQK